MSHLDTATQKSTSRPLRRQPEVAAGHHRRRARNALTGVIGGVMGLAPHVLHHIGLLAGTALVAGSGGTALFGVLGLVTSVPLLLRLRRRFGSWKAPAIGLVAFAAMFATSAFVIGPVISGRTERPSPSAPALDHTSHH